MRRPSVRRFTVLALALAVGLATAASPFAASSPDGLERVAADEAFLDREAVHAVQEDAPIPGYAFPGIEDARVATGVAGFIGVLGVFALGSGLTLLVRRRAGDRPPPTRAAA
jgi:hypothetical protein